MNRAAKPRLPLRSRPHGLSLIEILVGIVIGMLAIIIAMQVLRVAEGQRRTTSGGADAQTTGAIALTLLQQDIQQAGNGFMDQNILGCNVQLDNGQTITNFGHITINHPMIPAGDAGSETLLVAYGEPSGIHLGNRIVGHPQPNQYATETTQGFRLNEWVIAAPETRPVNCALFFTRVTNNPDSSTVPVNVQAGIANANLGFLFNLGMNPVVRAYAIREGQLKSCDFRASDCSTVSTETWPAVGEGIVAMRALYAKDTSTPPDGVPDLVDQTMPTTADEWRAVRGIRVALVARSGQLEKEDVTDVSGGAAAPTWSAAASAPISIPGSDWKRFRYRSFEATIHLPNVPVSLANGIWPPP